MRGKIDQLLGWPNIVRKEQLVRSIDNTEKMLLEIIDSAEALTKTGENLVRAAITGDEGLRDKIVAKQMRQMIATITRQIGLIEFEISNQRPGAPMFHAYSAMRSGYAAINVALRQSLELIESPENLNYVNLEKMGVPIGELIDEGYKSVSAARISTNRLTDNLRNLNPRSERERENKATVMAAISTLPESLDIEGHSNLGGRHCGK